MPRSLAFLLALATLSATAAVAQDANTAQSNFLPDSENPGTTFTQQQAAPIERSTAKQPARISSSEPIEGVWLRSSPNSSVQTVSANANGAEIRVEHGVANVSVHHPASNTEILVDLPGGQTSLLKDGLYTFNAETNTVRVLQGEADAYTPGHDKDAIKVKEDHQFVFGSGSEHAKDVNRGEARADLLVGYGEPRQEHGNGGYNSYGSYGPYGDGFYAGGYGYPYYGYGYPYYAWGGPWGYPGFGIGFGYYGGFRGGYGGFGGFRGRR